VGEPGRPVDRVLMADERVLIETRSAPEPA
jgi:hypothetical protein